MTLLEKAARKLEMPADLAGAVAKVEIIGCNEVYIENHKGLLLYENNEVRVNGGQAVIVLRGEGFIIKAMTALELRIVGLLFEVRFE